MGEICYKPIGYVSVDASDEVVKDKWEELVSKIVILPEYSEGLVGVEGFSHLIVVFHLHKVGEDKRRILKVKPRRWTKYGVRLEELPEVGVFATDSPHRPNPIGVSIVEVLKIEDSTIFVRGLDAYNGTPVLDIKPYTPSRRVKIRSLPRWFLTLTSKAEGCNARS